MRKLGSITIKLEVWKLLTGLRFSLGVTGMDKIRRLGSGDREARLRCAEEGELIYWTRPRRRKNRCSEAGHAERCWGDMKADVETPKLQNAPQKEKHTERVENMKSFE